MYRCHQGFFLLLLVYIVSFIFFSHVRLCRQQYRYLFGTSLVVHSNVITLYFISMLQPKCHLLCSLYMSSLGCSAYVFMFGYFIPFLFPCRLSPQVTHFRNTNLPPRLHLLLILGYSRFLRPVDQLLHQWVSTLVKVVKGILIIPESSCYAREELNYSDTFFLLDLLFSMFKSKSIVT